jgi:N-sulfoglucosamine sulfohydrolase
MIRCTTIVALLLAVWPVVAQGDDAPRPNILVCIADDVSFPHMGAYGCPWVTTPGFDRVAREGLLFQRAYTPNAKCAPSRSCLLTGRNSWQLGPACNHQCEFPAEFATYCEVLERNGYSVGCTGKGWGPGVAMDADGRPRRMTGQPFNARKCEPPTPAISNNDYAANFTDFLEAQSAAGAWCFWYGGLEPHRDYTAGSGVTLGKHRLAEVTDVPGFWPDSEVVRSDLLDYAFEIEWFDQHLARMLKELDRRGLAENTLVVVTSDNGMPFPRVKGQAYELSNHLPLAIRWPRGITGPGRQVAECVSFIDLAPTFLEVAGIDWDTSGMSPSPGQSLTDLFAGRLDEGASHRRGHVLLGKERHDVGRPHDQGYPIRGIVRGDLLYLHNFEPTRWPAGNPETGYLNCDGSPTKTAVLQSRTDPAANGWWELCFGLRPTEELYDLSMDPECVHNLAAQPEWESRRDELRELLFAELRAQDDRRMDGRGAEFEAYPYADPKNRNFYERFLRGEKLQAGWVNPTDFETWTLEGMPE